MQRTSVHWGYVTQCLSPATPPDWRCILHRWTSSALRHLRRRQHLFYSDRKQKGWIEKRICTKRSTKPPISSPTLSLFGPLVSLNLSRFGVPWSWPPGPAPRCCRPLLSLLCCFRALPGLFSTGFLQRWTHSKNNLKTGPKETGHTFCPKATFPNKTPKTKRHQLRSVMLSIGI